jgi:hypothetical protein
MKIRTILGLSALGAAYYAHQRRGGELTIDSIRDSAKALATWAKAKVSAAKDEASTAVDNAFDKSATATEPLDDIEEVFPTPGFSGGDGRFPGR